MSTPADISKAAETLRRGGVVAFPTETVYGLGADAFNEAAVARVYELKGRPAHNPLIVHVSGPEMARRVTRQWNDRADTLARRFWPGPLSILAPRSPQLPAIVTAGSDLVAVRCPAHPATLALLFELGSPLVGPSANLSGQVSPTRAEHVRESFGDRVMVLDGGPCSEGIESTVVDSTSSPVRVLRQGVVSPAEIAAVLGCDVELAGRPAEGAALNSPGLLDRHYAPGTPAHLFDHGGLNAALRQLGEGRTAVVLSYSDVEVPSPHEHMQLPGDAAGFAAMLYDALRQADRRSQSIGAGSIILIERPPCADSADEQTALWAAINDRLMRATTPLGG